MKPKYRKHLIYKTSFRQLLMHITSTNECLQGIDPFINSLTMPSVCHQVYRRQFMPIDSIALIPAIGYQT